MKRLKVYFVLILVIVVAGCKNTETKLVDGSNEVEGINYVEGTLDEALANAKEEGKYLFVVSTLEGCSACDDFLLQPLLDDKLKGELSNYYLVYRCNVLDQENRYLSWVFNSVASPTGFVFSPEFELINIVLPNEDPFVMFQALELGREGNVFDIQFNKRISLTGSKAISFFNDVFQAHKLFEEATNESLKEAFLLLRKSIETESYFYNNYLYAKVSLKLDLTDDFNHYMKQAFELDNAYNRKLYNNLY